MFSNISFEMGEFYSRFQHYINVTDPSTLLYSSNQIMDAKRRLEIGEDNKELSKSGLKSIYYFVFTFIL